MSKPRYKWFGFVKNAIYSYPKRLEELRRRQESAITPKYDAMPGSGEPTRTTENLATASLGQSVDKEMDSVRKAIETTKAMRDGLLRMKFIELMYWKRKPLPIAAEEVHISERTALRYNRVFVYMVAENMGVYTVGDWPG